MLLDCGSIKLHCTADSVEMLVSTKWDTDHLSTLFCSAPRRNIEALANVVPASMVGIFGRGREEQQGGGQPYWTPVADLLRLGYVAG